VATAFLDLGSLICMGMVRIAFTAAARLSTLVAVCRTAWRRRCTRCRTAALMPGLLMVLSRMLPILVAATGPSEALRIFILAAHDQRSCCKPLLVVFCLVFPAWPCSPVFWLAVAVPPAFVTSALFISLPPCFGC
jgi:hypothetical protein